MGGANGTTLNCCATRYVRHGLNEHTRARTTMVATCANLKESRTLKRVREVR